MSTSDQIRDPIIRLDGVSKSFSNATAPAVSDLSLDIARGEIVVLIGPSGCGKSTTLKMINRLIEPTSGIVEVDGRNVTEMPASELRLGIGFVIQNVGLFPHRTIAQNIATVPRLLHWDKQQTAERVEQLIDVVGLDPEILGRYPDELSGGQQQRVGVARALAADPPILLMDEPYSAVDPIVRSRLQDELLALHERVNTTIVFVTHDIDEALKIGDRLAILNVGGVLEQYDRPTAVLGDPANDFVLDFVGAERSLKRLALIPVHDMSLERGPVVDASASAGEAKDRMREFGVDWIGVCQGDTMLGWSWGSDLDPARRVGDADLSRFRVGISPDSSLRAALDTIVSSRTQVAVVVDDENRYLGMLRFDSINEEVVEEAVEPAEAAVGDTADEAVS